MNKHPSTFSQQKLIISNEEFQFQPPSNNKDEIDFLPMNGFEHFAPSLFVKTFASRSTLDRFPVS